MVILAATPVNAFLAGLLGYGVIALALVLVAVAISLAVKRNRKKKQPVQEVVAEPVSEAPKPVAPGSAGKLKLYNVEPKTAAMLMAIVADKMGKPINELRFISIKEVE